MLGRRLHPRKRTDTEYWPGRLLYSYAMRYWKRKRWRNVAYIYVLENASNFTYTHLEYLRFWRVTPEESVISLADIKDDPIFWQRWIPWNETYLIVCGDETYDRCIGRTLQSPKFIYNMRYLRSSPDVDPYFSSEIGPRISIPILRLIG